MNQAMRERKRKAEWKGAMRAAEPTMQTLPAMEMASEEVHRLLAMLYIKGKRQGERLGRLAMRGRYRFS